MKSEPKKNSSAGRARKIPEDYAFFHAIRSDDLDLVRGMIQADPSVVNTPAPKKPSDTKFMSPLQVSLCTGWHRKVAWTLLESGADVNYCPAKEVYRNGCPVLFHAVDVALWNSRRNQWDGKEPSENGSFRFVEKHTKDVSDEAFRLLLRVLELGADVNVTDHGGMNCLRQAVGEAWILAPKSNPQTGGEYPAYDVTPEMTEDFRRVFKALIDAGADRENRCYGFTKGRSIRECYSDQPVWRIIGDLFE